MMELKKFSTLVAFGSVIALLSFAYEAQANAINIPIQDNKNFTEELNDLNTFPKNPKTEDDVSSEELKLLESDILFYPHRDEDQKTSPFNFQSDSNFKYQVELFEPENSKSEGNEIEEQFRGAALHADTNNFSDEVIEMQTSKDIKEVSYFSVIGIVTVFSLFGLLAYAVLISYRHNLEQRYGNRVLLVTNADDDDDVLHHMSTHRNRNESHNNRQPPLRTV